MSVVATASTRRFRWRRRAGAAISPANAELPAPVRMTRRSGRAATSRRNSAARSSERAATSRHASGCCPISRIVAPPSSWAGMGVLIIGLSSSAACAGVGAQGAAHPVEDQCPRGGFEPAGAYPVVLDGQVLADQGQRYARAIEVGQQGLACGIDLVDGPVVAQSVAVAVAAGGALGERIAIRIRWVVALPVRGIG